ncbi:UNVERIFIED_CONTAM: hypothetical protein FKN15_010833 [Acipenser sinensis]
MLLRVWTRGSCSLLLLAAVLRIGYSQRADGTGSKVNSIKPSLLGQTPTQAANRSITFPVGVISKKGNNPGQVTAIA